MLGTPKSSKFQSVFSAFWGTPTLGNSHIRGISPINKLLFGPSGDVQKDDLGVPP